jgi:hypothetical protein
MKILKLLLSPVTFAVGFLAPLFAQVMNELSVGIEGIPNIAIALAVAVALGITAQIRGGWLWHTSKAR